MKTATYVARSIRGLEWVTAAELLASLDASILRIGHREVEFEAPLTGAVLRLGSVDDVFIKVGRIHHVPRTRSALAALAAGVSDLPWTRALRMLQTLRGTRLRQTVEVVASFLGRRNYNRSEIEIAVGRALSPAIDMQFIDH